MLPKWFFSVGAIVLVTIGVCSMPQASLAVGQCFCSTEYGKPAVEIGDTPHLSDCYVAQNDAACEGLPASGNLKFAKFNSCVWKEPNDAACDAAKKDWETKNAAFVAGKAGMQAQQNSAGGFLLDFDSCVTADTVTGNCRDITIFVKLLFRISRWLFGIIGSLALAFVIYGGFMLILSEGNSEKVQQGKGIITAAIIGLIVAFGGYTLVQFVATALGVDPTYILK